MANEEECKHGLVAYSCTICLHPEERRTARVPEKQEAVGPTIGAHYPGTCACGCRKRFDAGDDITKAEGGWCISDHTEVIEFG